MNFSPASLNPNDSLNVSITLQNDSAASVSTQGPDPGFVCQEGESFYTCGFPDGVGTVRVGVDFDARTGIDHPYRWGLGAPLGPGESRTINGAIKLTSAQSQNYWAGLVEERVAWRNDRAGVSAIQVRAATKPRVVHVQNENATTWVDQPDYWNCVDQGVIDEMVARGMMALTGAATPVDAWKKILPRYAVGQGIAIKINFTNDGTPALVDSLPQTLNAILRGLTQMGVRPEDVWVYDTCKTADYYVNLCQFPGVKFYDGFARGPVTFNSPDPSALIPFSPPLTHIRNKTVLTIGEGIFTGDHWNSPVLKMRTFGNKIPNRFFFSTDPVAIDSVMYDLLAAEWQFAAGADNYLRLASQLGMGVFERGDPRGAGYKTIEYQKI